MFCGIRQLSWEEEKDQSLPSLGGRQRGMLNPMISHSRLHTRGCYQKPAPKLCHSRNILWKSYPVGAEAVLLGCLLHRDESQVCGLTPQGALGLEGQRRAPWLWAGMNPSSLAPTASARLLCDPDLSSAGVTDGFPIREDHFEVFMRVLPPKQKLDTSFGESGQSCFSVVWPQRVGVTCPCTDTQERHSSRWVRGTRGEASCLPKVLKAAEEAEGFVLSNIQVVPRIPNAQTQGWQGHLKPPVECSRLDTPYCHAVGYQAMSRRPPCPSGDEPLSWNRLVTSTKTKQKKPHQQVTGSKQTKGNDSAPRQFISLGSCLSQDVANA